MAIATALPGFNDLGHSAATFLARWIILSSDFLRLDGEKINEENTSI